MSSPLVTKHKISFLFVIFSYTLTFLLVIQGEELLRTEDVVSLIEEQGESIALVMFSGR